MKHRKVLAAISGVCLVLLCGCSEDQAPSGGGLPEGEVVPDFTLTDVNPNSATYAQAVSARGSLGEISAWYFGHAT